MLNRFLILLFLCSPFFFYAQSVNGGFEQGFSDGTTLGWSTPDIAGANTTNDALSGRKAAKAWIFSYYKVGSWVSLTSVDDFIPKSGGDPVLPNKMTGYYKYEGESAECDMADVSLLIGMRNEMGKVDTLAFGATELKLSNRYRYFEFPIYGEPSADASFVSVKFSPAGRCNNHGGTNCCFLIVDDIELLPSPNAEEESQEGEETAEEEPKKVLAPYKAAKPKGRVLGRKARGRKARRERRRKRREGYKPATVRRTPPPARPAEKEKVKPTPKPAVEEKEEKIPDDIQKEIDRIRKVQEEEADKRMNGNGVEETAPAEDAREAVPAEETPEEDDFFTPEAEEEVSTDPVEKGWETEESSDED